MKAKIMRYEGRDDTVVFELQPYDRAVFTLPDGKTVEVTQDTKGLLYAHTGQGRLLIAPSSSNEIYLMVTGI